jgi:hypothetical protein
MKNPKLAKPKTKKYAFRVGFLAYKPLGASGLVNSDNNEGFSVVFVLTATLILIAGTATLLNQSASSMLGSIFQGQSLQARNVARSGMAYLISQINKEENRGLLELPKSLKISNPNSDTTLWTDSQTTTNHINRCTATYSNGLLFKPPVLSDLNLGGQKLNDGFFYTSDDGAISKQRSGSTRAFRIINRQNSKDFKIPLQDSAPLLDEAQTDRTFRLSVEAVVYRNSQSNEIVSSTILQEDFIVVPKGCKIPFGSHQDAASNLPKGNGNSNCALSRYALASNPCILPGLDPEGYGIIVAGSILADGTTIKNSRGLPVNPVYCFSANPNQCVAADNTSGNKMERLDIKLPELPKYPGSWGAQNPAPALKACTSLSGCPPNKLLQYDSTNNKTIFNAAAVTSAAQLPSNCTLYRNDIHCIYSDIDLSGSPGDLVFVSGNNTRGIRLYFPTAGNVIKQTLTNGTLRHCKVASCSGPGAFVDNTTDVSLFGSDCPYDLANPDICGDQYFTIKGSVREARFFVYAPKATVQLIGQEKDTFQGVIWAKGLDMRSTSVIPTIPKTGVADVFILMGILPDENNTFDQSLTGRPSPTGMPFHDAVARSSNRYRFFGN